MEEAVQRDFTAGPSACKAATVLVVDDDQGIRTLLTRFLSTMGFPFTQAARGDEALDLISTESFAVIFTDFHMPGMDGFTLASKIKCSSPGTPVIMITGSDRRVVEEKMKTGHVDSVLFKPFNLEEFEENVKIALTGGFACRASDDHVDGAQRGV